MPRVVFRNANLTDGSGAPRPNTSLVVEGDPGQDLSLLRPPENLKIVMKSGQMIETGRPRACGALQLRARAGTLQIETYSSRAGARR